MQCVYVSQQLVGKCNSQDLADLVTGGGKEERQYLLHTNPSLNSWQEQRYRVFFSKGPTQKISKYGIGPTQQDKMAKYTGPTQSYQRRRSKE